MYISKWLIKSSIFFYTFFYKWYFFYDFIFHKSEIRTVLLEVSIVIGLLKKTLLKTSKIVLMYSNSLARHFSSMFHAKCLLPRLDRLLLLRSCLQNFYQWMDGNKRLTSYWKWMPLMNVPMRMQCASYFTNFFSLIKIVIKRTKQYLDISQSRRKVWKSWRSK